MVVDEHELRPDVVVHDHRRTNDVLSVDSFGASAPAADLFEAFGFTPEQIALRAEALLERGERGAGALTRAAP